MARKTFAQALELGVGGVIETPFKKHALVKVADYLKYHKDAAPTEIRTPLESDNLVECGASKWDTQFINVDKEMLFELLVAAIVMDIPSLYFLAGAKASLLIKGKAPDKLVKDFKMSNDLPEDEEEQLSELFNAQKEKLQATPDESGLGGVALIINGIVQAAERIGVYAPSKTEEPGPSAISLKSFRHASWRAMILSDWTQMENAPEEVQSDRDLYFAAVSASCGRALQQAPGEFKNDRLMVLEAIKFNGDLMWEASAELRGDWNFMTEAITVNPLAFAGASDELRGNKDFLLMVARMNKGASMKGAREHLKADKDFVLQIAAQDPEAFKYAADQLRYDKEVVIQAVALNGLILQHVPYLLQADRDVVEAAVASDPSAAVYAHTAARCILGTSAPQDSEPGMQRLKREQDRAGLGATQPVTQYSKIVGLPLTKEASDAAGLHWRKVKAEKIVQFSALSTMTANMGQSNYIAANSFLDKLPFFARPEIDAVTLMWGAVGNIGMRWKAFASADMLNSNPEALMYVGDAAKVLMMTATRMDPPEWYAASFFDEWTRQAMLSPTAGVHSGGRPGENYQAPATSRGSVARAATAKREPAEDPTKPETELQLKAPELGPLGGWPSLSDFTTPEELTLAAQAAETELHDGMRVQLCNLQVAKNGQTGTVVKMCKDDKWKVKMDRGGHALLKACYLSPILAVDEAKAQAELAREKQESQERRARLKAAAQAK